MKFNLENLNPGTFFPFEDGEGGVTVRVANGSALDEINKKCIKKKFEFRRGQRIEIIDENTELKSSMLWDYVIVDWKGVFDSTDTVIPCNKETKELLMKGSVVFSSFIGECIEKLTEMEESYNEDLEKN